MTNIDRDPDDHLARLPQDVADQIDGAAQKRWVNWLLSWIPLVIMTGGFAVGGLWLWPTLEGAVEARVLEIAVQKGAWLYEYVFGFSLLALLFAWIFLSWMIPIAFISMMPVQWKNQFPISLLTDDSNGLAGRKALLRALDEVNVVTSAADITNAAAAIFLKDTARFTLPLVALSAYLLLLEFRAYDLYTAEGLERRPIQPWQSARAYAWEDVETVALGCNQTDDGHSLIYEPRWLNGPSPRIADVSVVGERSRLMTLEEIDRILKDGGAAFERWQWLKRDPLHPKCLGAFRAAVGSENAARIDNLLRVGEFPGDRAGDDL